MRTVILAALVLACVVSSAEARPRKAKQVAEQCFLFCEMISAKPTPSQRTEKNRRNSELWGNPTTRSARILAHPRGCPRRAFCGCGASLRVFGRSIRKLWLARNWFGFPRTSPALGMVAVRRHHVFVLERHLGGSTWLAYDANSGRGLTRLHPRSIAGYAIVNPHGSFASRGQAL